MLMNSLTQYAERPGLVTHVLAHLFRLYNHFTIQNPLDAGKVRFNRFRLHSSRSFRSSVQLVMDSMERHMYDRSLQTSGSACLYYVVDTFQNESGPVLEKYHDYLKRLLTTILRGMETHLYHSPVSRIDVRHEHFRRHSFFHSDDSQWFINHLSDTNAPSQSYCKIDLVLLRPSICTHALFHLDECFSTHSRSVD